ncbi:lipopolysaccharide assembly protein LapA domain-containing protein [Micromonospora echinospora]|uniref:LapA family protein n=1 Tax=Micromonospora echinospora TaxID=1877 RepID=UPI0033C52FC4
MTAPQDHRHPTALVNGHHGPDTVSRHLSGPPQVKRSRLGGLWVATVLFALVFLLLLVFVLQNGQRASVSFLGAHGHLPLGVALLLAAVFGILLVALPGTARIVQLRILNRRSVARSGPDSVSPTANPATRGTPRTPHQER